MRRAVTLVVLTSLASSCMIGSKRTRYAVNGALVAAGTGAAIASALDSCPMNPPGLLNFDDLCRGLDAGMTVTGVAIALAGVFGLVVANTLDSNDSK